MASDRATPEAQPEKQVGEMMQNLKLDSASAPKEAEAKAKSANGKQATAPAPAPAAEGSPSEATSSVTSLGDSGSTKGSEVEQETSVEPGVYYPSNNYYGVVYPGYEVVGNEWDEHGGMAGMDGTEYPYAGIQAENGSVVYYIPSYGYPQPAYNPYNPYIPGAVYGVDGQFLTHPSYYPGPMYQQPFTPPAYFQTPVAYGSEVPPAFTWDSGLVGPPNGNGVTVSPTTGVARTSNTVAAGSPTVSYSKVTPPARKSSTPLDSKGSTQSSEGLQSPSVPAGQQPASHGIVPSTGPQNQNVRPLTKIPPHGSTVQAGVLSKGYVPLTKVPGSQGKSSLLYTNHIADVKSNGYEWVSGERLKRGKVSNGNLDALNEQNRGPRINKTRNTWLSSPDAAAGDQEAVGNEVYGPMVNRDQYNLLEFPTKYDNALFFVIKSYSEDDVHKSIKYNVWASTPNGNKRLDAAYQTATERSGGKPGSYPVFLFFSVNASGQFCGVAEMTGPVDFNKNMNFWQQDKWNGFFPVKWHIIKDVPNAQFRHIILENNDNKPVTNSRDTQEIKFTQGIEMLNIFKNYTLKTSILDDFMFYENRQKTMQDKKRQPYHQDLVQTVGRFDAAAQKKGFGEQVSKFDGDTKANMHGDPKAINGSPVPSFTKHMEPSIGRKDQVVVPSNPVDAKKSESEGTVEAMSKKE